MTETMVRVICAAYGWRGRRKTGQTVTYPRCGEWATYESRGEG